MSVQQKVAAKAGYGAPAAPVAPIVYAAGYDGETAEYCPYTETSKEYDGTRAPLGLDIALGNMVLNDKPIDQQDLLDVGCGTGTFLKAVAGKLGSVKGLEYNDGMLEQARRNVPGVTLVQGSADKLPFDSASFDVVTVNQVVHHFPAEDNYAFLQRVCAEVSRVLRPGGCVVISTSAPEQQRDGFWWLSLFPQSSEAVCGRFPPIPDFISFLRSSGLEINANGVSKPSRTLMAEHNYLDKYGSDLLKMAEDPAYRAGDSSWAMAEASGELPAGIEKLRTMTASEREEFLEEREQLRRTGGQATFLCARKRNN